MTQTAERERPEAQIPAEDKERISKYLGFVKAEHDLVIHNIGDWTKGEIEIVIDPVEIYQAEQKLASGWSKDKEPPQAYIYDGRFSTYINHIVKRTNPESPTGFSYGTFHELVWNFERRGNWGNGVLPVWTDQLGVKRIGLIKIFRRPLGSWEAEVPGFSQEPGEKILATIKREIAEEIRCKVVGDPIEIGTGTTDSGLMHLENHLWYVPVELLEETGAIDTEEAISDRVFLTVDEVKKALIARKVKFGDEEIPIRDGRLLMTFCQALVRDLI